MLTRTEVRTRIKSSAITIRNMIAFAKIRAVNGCLDMRTDRRGFISLSYFVEGMLVAKDWVPVIIPVVSFATHMLWNSLTKFAFG